MSDTQSFKDKLDKEYSFPTLYKFKFIVPEKKTEEVTSLFAKHEVQTKPSKKGNYISVTVEIMAESSDKIIEIYRQASQIEGIISL